MDHNVISDEYLQKMNAYWRAANYLAAAQLYLLDNPLMREPLKKEHIKYVFLQNIYRLPDRKLVMRAEVDCVALVNGVLQDVPALDSVFQPNIIKECLA